MRKQTVPSRPPEQHGRLQSERHLRPGRQLFLDDTLVSETSLSRTFHRPVLHPRNPILVPATAAELNGGLTPASCPFEDGVVYDPVDRCFKLWYQAGWSEGTALAISQDGVTWERPSLDIAPGTNRILPRRPDYVRDNATIVMDLESSDNNARFKMLSGFRQSQRQREPPRTEVRTSPDGIHWSPPTLAGACGDNTTFYRDPFRRLWVFSVRSYRDRTRVRSYADSAEFLAGAAALSAKGGRWNVPEDNDPWLAADAVDAQAADPLHPAELYKFIAVAYESVMIGLFAIFYGPPTSVCFELHQPKVIDLCLGWSHDGRTWIRSPVRPFIAGTRRDGDWNRAYLHSVGGLFTIVGESLYFYFGGWSGRTLDGAPDMLGVGRTGLATLRRDGFASLDADAEEGFLVTVPFVIPHGHLFVNAAVGNDGHLVADVLVDGDELRGAGATSLPVQTDSTCTEMRWANGSGLSSLVGRLVRLRFRLRSCQIYSFWFSPTPAGRSDGYTAAGGPDFRGPTDRS